MMKKYISVLLTIVAVAGSSCKKTYLSELAINPNTPAITTAGLQLTGALTRTATITNGTSEIQYLCWDGYFAYSTSFQPSASLLLYSITTDTFDNFSSLYLNIANYNAIFTATSEPYYQAIAKIMIAYDYNQLVDQYNNVPYSQAVQGAAFLTPVYDNASAIYDDLLVQLDKAIDLILNAPSTAAFPAKNDLIYGATTKAAMLKWAAFANTLKLRLAVHQTSNTTLFAAKKAALTTAVNSKSAAIVAAGGTAYITTASEGAVNPGYTNTDVLQAPLDVAYGYKASGATQTNNPVYQANSYAINFFIGSGTPTSPDDPRLFQIYAPSTTAAANGAVVGTALGQTQPPTVGGTQVSPSKFSAFVLSPTKSAPLITAAEAWFLQAEAVKATLITGTVVDETNNYNNGVSAAFIELGLTQAQATTYLAKPQAIYPAAGSDAAREQAIITQKWASFNPYNPLEAYTELRRTGYPAVPLSILPGVTATTYVQRMLYPTVEYNTNAANVLAQGNIDLFASKIFWAK